ncbi:MAG: S9 family peptidase [Calditrichaeota bacterium]|nr:S9 family peptidase [Calditrichota bacterium]
MKSALSFFVILLMACTKGERMQAPIAKKEKKEMTIHGDTRIDNYYWMRLTDEQKNAKQADAQTQEVLDYLNAENAYTKSVLNHTEAFQEKLYNEIIGRIKQTDESVPYRLNGYFYYTRYEEGKEYPIYCRKKGSLEADEEILLNVNDMASGHDYYNVSSLRISSNNELLAYGVDTLSRRIYSIHFKNLKTGEELPDIIEGTTGSAAWANDNKTVFYTVKDPNTLRSYKIQRHILGQALSSDKTMFVEEDEQFYSYVYKTKSEEFIVIGSGMTESNEYQILRSDNPGGEFQLFDKREMGHEYSIDHYGDTFYIVTNSDKAKNFKLMSTPENRTTRKNWTDVIPHRDDVYLEGIEIFKNNLVIQERKNGLLQLRVTSWDKKSDYYIDFGEAAYAAYLSTNLDFDTPILRYYYTSLTTPGSTYDYNMNSKEKNLLKREEVLGGYNPDDYHTERLYASAKDGTKIPVSLVYKKSLKKDSGNPLLLYAYGSYGNSTDASFSSSRLSLIDRGFIYAIAHVRGGQEMGRDWYEEGRLMNKKNTFTDFLDCAHYLIDNKYTDSSQLFAYGGSAGGLLMGAIANMDGMIFKGIVAAVPFVDVVTTMLDESIPLTTFEYREWGNPNEKAAYDYMKSYSPYDQVEAKAYPAMLVTTGLFDSQVQYWEPAKWVAKLRDLKTDQNVLLMDCDMESGHGGASGRFKRYKRTALMYTFILDQIGINQ